MIPKANSFIAAAALALGVTLTAGRPAVAETMLDQFTVKAMGIAQVNDAGQCIVIVTVNSGNAGADEVRVVGDFGGAAKLYTSIGMTDGIIKSAKIVETTEFKVKRKLKLATLSDPISTLKNLHKAFVREAASSLETKTKRAASIAAGVVLGWDVMAADTAEKREDVEMRAQLASVTETNDNANAKVTAYATALTNAGINPVTYLPIV